MSGDLLEEIMATQPTPLDLVLVAIVNIGILLLPLLVLATAVLKLRRFPEHRTLHWGLALSAGLAVALSVVTLLGPGALPEEWRQSGVVSFTWVFLFPGMALRLHGGEAPSGSSRTCGPRLNSTCARAVSARRHWRWRSCSPSLIY